MRQKTRWCSKPTQEQQKPRTPNAAPFRRWVARSTPCRGCRRWTTCNRQSRWGPGRRVSTCCAPSHTATPAPAKRCLCSVWRGPAHAGSEAAHPSPMLLRLCDRLLWDTGVVLEVSHWASAATATAAARSHSSGRRRGRGRLLVVEVDGHAQCLGRGGGPLEHLLGPVHAQEPVHLALAHQLPRRRRCGQGPVTRMGRRCMGGRVGRRIGGQMSGSIEAVSQRGERRCETGPVGC